MGRMQQRKGRAAELELCRILNERGIPAKAGAAQNYGTEPDISGVSGFHCEVKRCERLKMGDWLQQAERDALRFGGEPAVFFRRSREQWHVVLPLESFINLFRSNVDLAPIPAQNPE